MYVMYKEGLRDNHWTIARKRNQNLIATVNTRYGTTRKIKMNSIRQGGVLSVMQFRLLMDETSKEITKENLGNQLEG